MQAFILKETGDHNVLNLSKIKDPVPKEKEVVVRHKAIGVNFNDVCFRRGQYGFDKLPQKLGSEACGIVEAVGPGVVDFEVGDRVAYGTGPFGAYAEKSVIHQSFLVTVPQNITDEQAAGSLTKGLMAHTLLHRVYPAVRAKRILVHAAAGGVGQFLCQWARHLGVEVIGTVGDDRKIPIAQNNGCKHVINYTKEDFVEKLGDLTDHQGVGVVYDSVGKDTLDKSIDCLWPMGVCVSFGEASGRCGHLDLDHMMINSLYVTRPTLALYKANRAELVLSAAEVFAAISQGVLKPQITSYPFKDAALAHNALESRASTGSLVLTL